MSSLYKKAIPANDVPLYAAQRLACVALPRRSEGWRWGVAGIVVVTFAVGMGFWVEEKSAPRPAAVVAEVKPVVPFDIKIDASSLAPQDAVMSVENELPPQVIGAEKPPTSVMDIAVDDPVESFALTAQQAAQRGDLRDAVRYQRRAAQLEPENMAYRLTLAIFYDRLGEGKKAAVLYQQVVQAYAQHDSSLSRRLDIGEIRARLDYLQAE